jgi:hypothetical protein
MPEPLGKFLDRFEREKWGTNDWDEIQEKIREGQCRERQEALTGMEEEQADWESDDDPEWYWDRPLTME